MKTLLLLLGFVLSLQSFAAETLVRTVVLSPEEIIAKKAPFTCDVFHRKDGSVALHLTAKEPSETNGSFESFDLRVLKKPIAASEIGDRLRHKELWAWHRPSSTAGIRFVLTEEEIPKSYIVGRWSLGRDSSGVLQAKDVCFSVEALVRVQPEGATSR